MNRLVDTSGSFNAFNGGAGGNVYSGQPFTTGSTGDVADLRFMVILTGCAATAGEWQIRLERSEDNSNWDLYADDWIERGTETRKAFKLLGESVVKNEYIRVFVLSPNTADTAVTAIVQIDRLDSVNVHAISDDSTAADNAEAMFDGTGYAGGTIKLGVDLVSILGTALTETAGYIAAAFKKFFNVATPVMTAEQAFPTNFSSLVISASGIANANMELIDGYSVNATGAMYFYAHNGTDYKVGVNSSGHVSRVVLVDTTTTNTDMRGTDGANTTAPDNTGIGNIYAIVNSGTHGNAALKTLIDDVPTLTEFNARTIVAANYALEATLTAMKGTGFDTAADSLNALRTRGDAAWLTWEPSTDTVDGVTYEAAIKATLAVISGATVVNGNEIAFKARDGVTTVITVTVDGTTAGYRTGSVMA